MAIRSTAAVVPAGSYGRICCSGGLLMSAEELIPFLRNYSHMMLILFGPSCPPRWQRALGSALVASYGTCTWCGTAGFMAANLRCSAARRPADRSGTSAAPGGLAAILASAGWHSEQLVSGATGVSNDPIWPLSYSPRHRGPAQTSV